MIRIPKSLPALQIRQKAAANIALLSAVWFVAIGIAVVLLSFVVEAFRRRPKSPDNLRWAPDIPIRFTHVCGHHIRYIKTGEGPVLLLLHTLRTQLDLFEKVVPELARYFTVYALDYPGHGYSDIPEVSYNANFFADSVEGFLDDRNLQNVCVAGVSIGASISLILAARGNARIRRVFAVNPYDYDKGRGLARSSLLGRLIVMSAPVPILGGTVMRLRNFLIMKAVFAGGVTAGDSIPGALLREMYAVGNRSGHHQAFLNLLRNAATWEEARDRYDQIAVPVLIVWGDQDWARYDDREIEQKMLRDCDFVTIDDAGHFLPLDQPEAFIGQLRRFCAETG